MQINDYLNVLRKRWWVILLVAFSAAAAAYGFSKLQTPLFRSRVIYQVLFNRLDTGSNMFVDNLLNSYVGLVYQPDQMQAISDQLGLDVQSGEALMKYVRIQPQPESMRIVVEVDYFDPGEARRIASAVGGMLNARIVEANRNLEGEDRAFLQLAQSAQVGVLAKPQTRINVLAGGLLGAILGLLLVFILEYMDDTLKTADDVERFAGLPTIGTIPSGAAAGGRWARPLGSAGFVAGLNRTADAGTSKDRHD
jgi:capsular polysaccharide biosynthesis protein